MREYGELPHFVEQRLNSGAAAAARYCAQFPSPLTGAVAAFVAYVAAGVAAVVIGIALTHDYLMERPAWGHTLVWWLAACGMVLAVSRSLAEEGAPTHDAVRTTPPPSPTPTPVLPARHRSTSRIRMRSSCTRQSRSRGHVP